MNIFRSFPTSRGLAVLSSKQLPLVIVVVIFGIILPPLLPSFHQSLATKVVVFALLAMSLNLIVGYTGLLSLGHAAYFGVAAYTVGVLTVKYGVSSFWVAGLGAIALGTLVAAIFGFLALRTKGIYFLLVTLALGQLVFSAAREWRDITGADNGLAGIPRPDLGFPVDWNSLSYYYFVFVVFIVVFFIMRQIIDSPFGLALQGIRDNERRMRMLGFNIWLYQYVAFIIAGGCAAIAGVLFVYLNRIVVPNDTGILTSANAYLMVALGGPGTKVGPILGAVLIILIQFFASDYLPERWPLVLGGIFILAAYARGGLASEIVRHFTELRKRLARGQPEQEAEA